MRATQRRARASVQWKLTGRKCAMFAMNGLARGGHTVDPIRNRIWVVIKRITKDGRNLECSRRGLFASQSDVWAAHLSGALPAVPRKFVNNHLRSRSSINSQSSIEVSRRD